MRCRAWIERERGRGFSGPAIPSDSVIHSGYLRHPPYFLRHPATSLRSPATSSFSTSRFFLSSSFCYGIPSRGHDTTRHETREATTSVSCAFAMSGPSRFPEEIPRLDSLARPIQILSAFDARSALRIERRAKVTLGNLRNSNIPSGEKGRERKREPAKDRGREDESFIPCFPDESLLRASKTDSCTNGYNTADTREVQQCVNSKDFKLGENAK